MMQNRAVMQAKDLKIFQLQTQNNQLKEKNEKMAETLKMIVK